MPNTYHNFPIFNAFKIFACPAFILVLLGCSKTATTHIEILAGIRHVAADQAWNLEENAYTEAFKTFLNHDKTELVITPISDHSQTEIPLEKITSSVSTLMGTNSYDAEQNRIASEEKAKSYIAELSTRNSGSDHTEIISAIVAAYDRFAVLPTEDKKILIIISTEVEQSSALNMGNYNLKLNLPAIRESIIRHLRETGKVANLSGVDVCMLGRTSQGNWIDTNRARGIQLFWQDYFKASQAHLVGYGATCKLLDASI